MTLTETREAEIDNRVHRAQRIAELDSAAGAENFPVASRLLPARHRKRVIAFYRYARYADDIADTPRAQRAEQLAQLDRLEEALVGRDGPGVGMDLFRALGEGRADCDKMALDAARQLLVAFRRDVDGTRCADWADLMSYCDHSAAPVGRFLLAIHGEDSRTYPPSDALCAVLQVLNHCQDISSDWQNLGRRYLPGDWMQEEGADDHNLSRSRMPPPLQRVLERTLQSCDALLDRAAPLPRLISARGLRAQAGATLFLARRLRARLHGADPLARRVALQRPDFLRAGIVGLWSAR
ncbi:squalene/phytoene synthase family protein [Palleronia abyssalis]|uniref:All-trans-phytoene synthase n=1 Tax=Palleronia abyssalis TaxID=1501240 RepID=A0A2R8BYT0_9RHOB|nr:squalene/phytoene synthase family protein [Palleronia abyssalis]SPJ25292.1 All-trans-phytoene synthase [Palleronia abyssalis]